MGTRKSRFILMEVAKERVDIDTLLREAEKGLCSDTMLVLLTLYNQGWVERNRLKPHLQRSRSFI